jgi:hypothetical protein
MRGTDAGPYGGHVRASAEARGDHEGVQDGAEPPSFSSVALRRLRSAPHGKKIAAGMVRVRGRCARGSRRRSERSTPRPGGTQPGPRPPRQPQRLPKPALSWALSWGRRLVQADRIAWMAARVHNGAPAGQCCSRRGRAVHPGACGSASRRVGEAAGARVHGATVTRGRSGCVTRGWDCVVGPTRGRRCVVRGVRGRASLDGNSVGTNTTSSCWIGNVSMQYRFMMPEWCR